MPFYNVEQKLFLNCIKSIIEQKYRDFELIIINDGSNMKFNDVLNNVKKMDSRIHIFRKENGGVSTARNAGVKVARGKYIAFLDADDSYADTDALERMFHTCEKFRIPICGCRWVYKAYKDGTRKKAGLFKESEKKMLSYRDCQMHDFYLILLPDPGENHSF